MAGAPPADTVKTFLSAMARKDYDSGLKHLAANCEYHNPPPLGKVVGPVAVRTVLEPFFAPTLENEFVFLREVASGAFVFNERIDRHRLQDRWVELPVTGVFEVQNGQIVYWRDYFDIATLLAAWPELAAALAA